MQVRDLVALGRYPHGGAFSAPTAQDRAAVAQAIVRADIATLVDRSTDTLSGGEWQRVRIARALAQGGRAIVLDEPTTYLDIAHEMAVFELCDSLARQGLCVVLRQPSVEPGRTLRRPDRVVASGACRRGGITE